MLHEGQHAIQSKEGFARGGNTEQFGDAVNSTWRQNPIQAARLKYLQKTDDYAKELEMSNAAFAPYSQRLAELDSLLDSEKLSLSEWAKQADEVLAEFKKWQKQNLPTLDEVESLSKQLGPEKVTAYDQYKNLAGEVEARNVQRRMDFSPDERRMLPPWVTEDVPREQQIIRGVLDAVIK